MDIASITEAVRQSKADVKKRMARVESWARAYRGDFRRFSVMAAPPTITPVGNASVAWPSKTNGAVSHAPADLDLRGSIFVDALAFGNASYPYKKPTHITDATGAKSGGNAPLRVPFLTDAPLFDACFLEQLKTQFNIIIDGQYVARDRLTSIGSTGGFRYFSCNFGTDVVTYGKVDDNINITAAGSGYAPGDLITLDGGSNGAAGTPTIVRVGNAGGPVYGVTVVQKGAYTTIPTGTFSQVSTTGSGTGFQMGASFFHPQHSTRRMRHCEIVWSDPSSFQGIVVPQGYTVMPAPQRRAMPKLVIIGDSQQGTYLGYGGSAMGASIAQALDMWDRCTISFIGGTGFNAGDNNTKPAWVHPNRQADFAALAGDIYLIIGSQNDTANAATTTAVTTVVNGILTANPNAYVVGIGPVVGNSASLTAAIKAGYLAATRQDRVRFIDNVTVPWIPDGQRGDWVVDSDQNHLSQEGMDRFAAIAAPQIANAILDMVGI